MPISFDCKFCGKRLKAPDSAAGKTSKCPQCGKPVTCPEPVYDAEPVADQPEILDDVDAYSDLDDGKPYGVTGPPPEASDEHRRPCPMCGEMILASAAKCRFCGEVFDKDLKKAQTKKKKKKKKKSWDPEDEDLSGGEWAVAIICSGIGCIAGIVWMIQGKPKGIKMLVVSIIADLVKAGIRFAIMSQGGGPGVGGP